jgi:hypothetical protein
MPATCRRSRLEEANYIVNLPGVKGTRVSQDDWLLPFYGEGACRIILFLLRRSKSRKRDCSQQRKYKRDDRGGAEGPARESAEPVGIIEEKRQGGVGAGQHEQRRKRT